MTVNEWLFFIVFMFFLPLLVRQAGLTERSLHPGNILLIDLIGPQVLMCVLCFCVVVGVAALLHCTARMIAFAQSSSDASLAFGRIGSHMTLLHFTPLIPNSFGVQWVGHGYVRF